MSIEKCSECKGKGRIIISSSFIDQKVIEHSIPCVADGCHGGMIAVADKCTYTNSEGQEVHCAVE